MCFCSFWNGPFSCKHVRIPPFSVTSCLVQKNFRLYNRKVAVRSSVATSSRHPRDMMELGDHREFSKKRHPPEMPGLDLWKRWFFYGLCHGKSPLNHYLGDFLKNLFQVFYANPRRWWVLSRLWKRWGCNKSYKWPKIDGELGLDHPSYRGYNLLVRGYTYRGWALDSPWIKPLLVSWSKILLVEKLDLLTAILLWNDPPNYTPVNQHETVSMNP